VSRRPSTSSVPGPGRTILDPSPACAPARRSGRLARLGPPIPAVDPAKLVVPPPPVGAIPRPRIAALLDAAPGTSRIVSAPAGYGRTTVLADWARGAGRRCAWLTVDGRDDDVEHLRVHARAALDVLSAGPGTLIVDDAHRVTAPDAREVLRELVGAPPHGVRVLVGLRSPSGGASDLGAPTVDADVLALTADETAAVLRDAWGVDLDERRVGAAHATAGGWPAGLAIVADAVAGAPGWRSFTESLDAADAAITRRVAADVLATTDGMLRDGLVRTSVLRRLDLESCAAVLGDDRAGELLERGRRAGVLAADRDGGLVHRGPFRRALRALLAERSPAEPTLLHRRASTWFAAHGAPGPAAEHAAAAGDVLRAAAIADAHVAARGARPDGPPTPGATAARWPDDVPTARRALDEHHEADATVRGVASVAVGLALWRAGRDADVRAHLEPRIGAIVHPAARSWSLAVLALAVAPEDPARAEALARHARRISRRPGATWLEPVLAHQALADALRARGDLGAAHVALGEAAVRTGAVPDSAHHHLTLLLRAELAIAAGDPEAALRVLGAGALPGPPPARVVAARERARRLAGGPS
jgi:LuxR family transcriptional regulator, maltose regulon positive regulatory protein